MANAVIINEIHYDPDISTEFVEFIELYNTDGNDVDISGWSFTQGISYQFPEQTVLPAGRFILVAQDVEAVRDKWGAQTRDGLGEKDVLGPFLGKLDNEGETIVLCDAAGDPVDRTDYGVGFPWPVVGEPIPYDEPGTGHSIQLVNPDFDNDIPACWRPAAPTPGRPNNWIYTTNVPSAIGAVRHNPSQPTSSQESTITLEVTDPDEILVVFLEYQVVSPGHYIPARLPRSISEMNTDQEVSGPKNSAYTAPDNWTRVDVPDNGTGADAVAQDHVYTALIPAQAHRSLVRYRFHIADRLGHVVTIPYADDPVLNFAYFVYDGIPEYEGISSQVLESFPVHQLITRWEDLQNCMGWNGQSRMSQGSPAWFVYNWYGTLIHDGVVYDHIRYRIRGGNGRYYPTSQPNSKRSMRYRFNRGQYFQARDRDGNPYSTRWRTLTTTKGFDNRQTLTYALNEHVNFYLFNQIGVPAPYSYYFHFRVIRGEHEAPDPWRGDFWGLGFAQETYDVRFLEAHHMARGNLYKLINSTRDAKRQQRYQADLAVIKGEDHNTIENRLSGHSGADFIRQHVRLDRWNAYHALSQAIRHYDFWPSANKNATWYFEPNYTPENDYLGQMWTLPWDTDASWGPSWNSGHDVVYNSLFPAGGGGSDSGQTRELQPGYFSAVREVRDLLWQRNQIEPTLDYFAAEIAPLVEADRIRWHNAPRDAGSYQGLGGKGMTGLDALVQDMKNFAFVGGSWPGGSVGAGGRARFLDNLADNAEGAFIPDTPAITYVGEPDFPVNDLRFQTSAFSDPQGNHSFAALRWRIAEVEPDAVPDLNPVQPGEVLVPAAQTWTYFEGHGPPSETPGAWRELDFNDAEWSGAAAPLGYGETFIRTELDGLIGKASTLYLRLAFVLDDPSAFNKLEIEVLFDDAFILWINGNPALQGNAGSNELPWNATVNNRSDDHTYSPFSLSRPEEYLLSGTNILAVQVINQSLSSSDLFFDLRVRGVEGDSDPVPDPNDVATGDRLTLEITPTWESQDLSVFQAFINIPSGRLNMGSTYRVRCKMRDLTERWSHWSDPIQFTTAYPLARDGAGDMRITEIMYNPAAPTSGMNNDEFEFIELTNTGPETIDISSLSFIDGIIYDFADSSIVFLNPGERVLLVENIAAFVQRYGPTLSSRVAGEYQGRLANNGETLVLTERWQGTVAEFAYDDAWYPSTDGGGHSLALKNPENTDPETWDQKEAWQASIIPWGSPGY